MNKQTKEIKAYVKNAKKEGYYNIFIEIDGFRCQVTSKFLNAKQEALLYHKLDELMNEDEDYDGPYDSAGSLDGEKYLDKNGKVQTLKYKGGKK